MSRNKSEYSHKYQNIINYINKLLDNSGLIDNNTEHKLNSLLLNLKNNEIGAHPADQHLIVNITFLYTVHLVKISPTSVESLDKLLNLFCFNSIKNGNNVITEYILENINSCDYQDSNGDTLLHIAVRNGDAELVEKICKRFSNPEILNNNHEKVSEIILSLPKENPIRISVLSLVLMREITRADSVYSENKIEEYIKLGADVNFYGRYTLWRNDNSNSTIKITSFQTGFIFEAAIFTCLLDQGNAMDLLTLLIKYKVNLQAEYNGYPLIWNIVNNNLLLEGNRLPGILDFLLINRMNVLQENHKNKTILENLFDQKKDNLFPIQLEVIITQLHISYDLFSIYFKSAVKNFDKEKIQFLLSTPYAAELRNLNCNIDSGKFKTLADFNFITKNGLFKILRNIMKSKTEKTGNTLLQNILNRSEVDDELISALLDEIVYSVDINSINNLGKTALDIAIENKHEKSVDLLRKKIAKQSTTDVTHPEKINEGYFPLNASVGVSQFFQKELPKTNKESYVDKNNSNSIIPTVEQKLKVEQELEKITPSKPIKKTNKSVNNSHKNNKNISIEVSKNNNNENNLKSTSASANNSKQNNKNINHTTTKSSRKNLNSKPVHTTENNAVASSKKISNAITNQTTVAPSFKGSSIKNRTKNPPINIHDNTVQENKELEILNISKSFQDLYEKFIGKFKIETQKVASLTKYQKIFLDSNNSFKNNLNDYEKFYWQDIFDFVLNKKDNNLLDLRLNQTIVSSNQSSSAVSQTTDYFRYIQFHDRGLTELNQNTDSFIENFKAAVRLYEQDNKRPLLIISMAPGDNRHFVGMILYKKTPQDNINLLFIDPLGITQEEACYQTFAKIQKSKLIEHIFMSSIRFQQDIIEIYGKVSCGPIMLAIAGYIKSSSPDQFQPMWDKLLLDTHSSSLHEASGLRYHGVHTQLLSLIPLSLHKILNIKNNKQYIDMICQIRNRHFGMISKLCDTDELVNVEQIAFNKLFFVDDVVADETSSDISNNIHSLQKEEVLQIQDATPTVSPLEQSNIEITTLFRSETNFEKLLENGKFNDVLGKLYLQIASSDLKAIDSLTEIRDKFLNNQNSTQTMSDRINILSLFNQHLIFYTCNNKKKLITKKISKFFGRLIGEFEPNCIYKINANNKVEIFYDEETKFTALISVARYGNNFLADKLLQRLITDTGAVKLIGQTLFYQTDKGYNALLIAILYGHINIVITLVNAAIQYSVDLKRLFSQEEECGYTPFLMACRHGYLEIAEYLISTIQNQNSALQTAILMQTDMDLNTALKLACKHSHPAIVQYLFKIADEKTTDNWLQPDDQGNTILHIACNESNLEIITILFSFLKNHYKNKSQFESYINVRNHNGLTALDVANKIGDKSILNLFSELLDPVIINSKNLIAESIVTQSSKLPDSLQNFHDACVNGQHTTIKELLESSSMSDATHMLYIKVDGIYPLQYAAKNGHFNVVSNILEINKSRNIISLLNLLLQHSATTSIPIHLACENNYNEIVEILLNCEVRSKSQIDHKDIHSRKLLTIACMNGHKKILETILKWMSERLNHKMYSHFLNIPYKKLTPIQIIKNNKFYDLIDIIEKYNLIMENKIKLPDSIQPRTLDTVNSEINSANKNISLSTNETIIQDSKLEEKLIIQPPISEKTTQPNLEHRSDREIIQNVMQIFIDACIKGEYETVRKLLESSDNNIILDMLNTKVNGLYPLAYASKNGYIEIAKCILEVNKSKNLILEKALLTQGSIQGNAAISLACASSHYEIVNLLLSQEKSEFKQLYLQNFKRQDLLYFIIVSRNKKMLETVLDWMLNFVTNEEYLYFTKYIIFSKKNPNPNKRSPLKMAEKLGFTELVDVFKEYESRILNRAKNTQQQNIIDNIILEINQPDTSTKKNDIIQEFAKIPVMTSLTHLQEADSINNTDTNIHNMNLDKNLSDSISQEIDMSNKDTITSDENEISEIVTNLENHYRKIKKSAPLMSHQEIVNQNLLDIFPEMLNETDSSNSLSELLSAKNALSTALNTNNKTKIIKARSHYDNRFYITLNVFLKAIDNLRNLSSSDNVTSLNSENSKPVSEPNKIENIEHITHEDEFKLNQPLITNLNLTVHENSFDEKIEENPIINNSKLPIEKIENSVVTNNIDFINILTNSSSTTPISAIQTSTNSEQQTADSLNDQNPINNSAVDEVQSQNKNIPELDSSKNLENTPKKFENTDSPETTAINTDGRSRAKFGSITITKSPEVTNNKSKILPKKLEDAILPLLDNNNLQQIQTDSLMNEPDLPFNNPELFIENLCLAIINDCLEKIKETLASSNTEEAIQYRSAYGDEYIQFKSESVGFHALTLPMTKIAAVELTLTQDETSSVRKNDIIKVKINKQNYIGLVTQAVNKTFVLTINNKSNLARHHFGVNFLHVEVIDSISSYAKEYNILRNIPLQDNSLVPKLLLGQSLGDSLYTSSVELHQSTQSLNSSQNKPIIDFMAQENNIIAVQGPPGTGKTATLVSTILSQYYYQKMRNNQRRIFIAAPSNNAAQRILESLQKASDTHNLSLPIILIISKNRKQITDERLFKYTPEGLITQFIQCLDKLMSYLNVESRNYLNFLHLYRENFTIDINRFRLHYDINIQNHMRTIESLTKNFTKVNEDNAEHVLKNLNLLKDYFSSILKNDSQAYLESYAPVILCTLNMLLSINIQEKSVLFIDEIGQATIAAIIAAVKKTFAFKLFMIGDDAQLSALIFSKKAKSLGLGVSLLNLFRNHENLYLLNTQYRMPEILGNFISRTFYQSKLHSFVGKSLIDVDSKTADLPSIAFIDLPLSTVSRENKWENKIEADYLIEMLTKLSDMGIDFSEIGIISFYRKQIELLNKLISKKEDKNFSKLTINSVDGFQGREKSFIIISSVRHTQGDIGFLDKNNRINVALSRAQKHLFLLGHSNVLKQSDALKKFMEYTKKHGSYYTPKEFIDLLPVAKKSEVSLEVASEVTEKVATTIMPDLNLPTIATITPITTDETENTWQKSPPKERVASYQQFFSNNASGPKYNWVIDISTLNLLTTYIRDLSLGTIKPGRLLNAKLNEKKLSNIPNIITNEYIEQFFECLMQTKLPQIFAESVNWQQDWNSKEFTLLGNTNFAADVTIYDDGRQAGADAIKYEKPWMGTLLFSPSPLLTENSPDLFAVSLGGRFNQEKYYQLFEARLLPLLIYANNSAITDKKSAFITIPGMGCGAFAGVYKNKIKMDGKSLETEVALMLRKILEKHAASLTHIQAIYYDPYNEIPQIGTENISNINLIVNPLLNKDRSGKPQLCPPETYNEKYRDTKFFSFVAWDHFSFPGNDFWQKNMRQTDDGRKAAASNVMQVVTNIAGEYKANLAYYKPPQRYMDWKHVVSANNISLTANNNVFVAKDGSLYPLREIQLEKMMPNSNQQKRSHK